MQAAQDSWTPKRFLQNEGTFRWKVFPLIRDLFLGCLNEEYSILRPLFWETTIHGTSRVSLDYAGTALRNH